MKLNQFYITCMSEYGKKINEKLIFLEKQSPSSGKIHHSEKLDFFLHYMAHSLYETIVHYIFNRL